MTPRRTDTSCLVPESSPPSCSQHSCSWLRPPASQAQDDALDKLLQKLDEKAKPDTDPSEQGRGVLPPQAKSPPTTRASTTCSRSWARPPTSPPLTSSRSPACPACQAPTRPHPAVATSPTDPLKEKDKNLDEHLEGMLRIKKSKDQQQQQQQGEETGPLAEAIKKMQEAERRLADNDTGEQTRKTQGDVVKELDQILEQLRQARSSQSKPQQKTKEIQQAGQKPGNQPGQKPGENPGNDGKGTNAQAPQKPSVGEVLAGQKDTWGDLPPHLREEMENVFREEMLPAKRDLIIRYYSSVARKGRAGGDR